MRPIHKREFSLAALTHWFEGEKRSFPWRRDPNPYQVWVSEVMLQQTRASVVVPYFERWMARFCDIPTLAKADETEVIKLWEGLGYYSRARSLHQGARYLAEHHGGKLPSDPRLLAKVKGIGPYTSGAILSFAFHKKAAAVDGNVLRVMSRLFCIEEQIDRASTRSRIEKEVERVLPDENPHVVMEALIELGALVCKPKPQCAQCPLQGDCQAYLLGKTDQLPKKREKVQVEILNREVYLIEYEGSYLVQTHEGDVLMSGLSEFPYFEKGALPPFLGQIEPVTYLQSITHTFTRYKAHLYPSLWKARQPFSLPGFVWVESKRLVELAFSSGHRKILTQLLEEHADLTH